MQIRVEVWSSWKVPNDSSSLGTRCLECLTVSVSGDEQLELRTGEIPTDISCCCYQSNAVYWSFTACIVCSTDFSWCNLWVWLLSSSVPYTAGDSCRRGLNDSIQQEIQCKFVRRSFWNKKFSLTEVIDSTICIKIWKKLWIKKRLSLLNVYFLLRKVYG